MPITKLCPAIVQTVEGWGGGGPSQTLLSLCSNVPSAEFQAVLHAVQSTQYIKINDLIATEGVQCTLVS